MFPVSLLVILAAGTGEAQSGGAVDFPYIQRFDFVTATTTMFPTGNVDGGELSADAGTPMLWTTSAASHGINNNGGAGGAIRLQSTAGAGAAGFVWNGSMNCRQADSLTIRWTKIANGAASSRVNELRVATNDGAGALFTDVPLTDIEGGAWPAFDNTTGAQSGWLRIALPSTLDGSSDVRIRIYSTNRSGTGNHPRVLLDSLGITAEGAGIDRTTVIDPPVIERNLLDTLRIVWSPLSGADGYLVIGRQDSTPIGHPADGRWYRAGELLGSATALATTSDTTAIIPGLARNSVWFIRIIPMRECDTSYGAASTALAVAVPDTGSRRRFALRAGRLDTIRHDGVTIRFMSPPSADGSILVARRNRPGGDGLPMHRNGRPPIDRLAGTWWEVTPRGLGRFLADLELDIAGIPGVSHVEDLEIVHRFREDLLWGDFIPSAVVSDSAGTCLVAGELGSFGNYAIGAAGVENVLPVTLVSFEGATGRDGSLLIWRTASELGSAGFILSRAPITTAGAGPFVEIATVNAKGGAMAAARYEYVDRDGGGEEADNLYRLEERSLTGEITELARLRLRRETDDRSGAMEPVLGPNPASGRRTTLELPSDLSVYLRVDLHAIDGIPIRTAVDRMTEPGERRIELDMTGLPAGLYYCRVMVGTKITLLPLMLLP